MEPIRLPKTLDAQLWHGLTDAAAVAAARAIVDSDCAPLAVVFLPDHARIDVWAQEIALHCSAIVDPKPTEILRLPEQPESADEDTDVETLDRTCDRLTALTRMMSLGGLGEKVPSGKTAWLLTTPRAFFTPTPSPHYLLDREITVRVGDVLPFNQLVEKLGKQLDYHHESLCETPGQFAVRGGLIDVYPVNAQEPYRIDFFGDEVEAIRAFDPTTQRSEQSLAAITVAAIPSRNATEKARNIFGYLPRRISWLFWEPGKLIETAHPYFHAFERIRSMLPTFADLADDRAATGDRWHGLAEFDLENPFLQNAGRTELQSETIDADNVAESDGLVGADRKEAEHAARDHMLGLLADWEAEGEAIILACASAEEEERVRALLAEIGSKGPQKIALVRGRLSDGFWLRSAGLPADGRKSGHPADSQIMLPARALFGKTTRRSPVGIRRRRLPRRSRVDQLLDFAELAEGDYLVHLAHGICVFRGLTKIELHGKPEEVISLEFADAITLHLPLHESHLLSRYVGLGRARPALARLGGSQWGKTRHAAERATLDLAASLLTLQANRNSIEGFAFSPDTAWQRQFEENFAFEETADQITAIRDVKKDMEGSRPMDRLICGDVGYGKTEVAIRGAFKAVMDGKQAVVLVPTTVLAQQHFNTFRERMSEFPVTVEMLSRFRTKAQQSEILKQVKAGKIDILIGTHRILGKDLKFRDLGLLVIDEEHRFGVRHKEELKRMRTNVDVITMSATPIPRTLYLAMMGARDLSVIETPPVDRLPIRTLVKTYSPELVREAIRFEVNRGGQVFYLHNRVQSIDSVALRVQELCPELRVAVGHGQMSESMLERIMTRFVAGEFDVLVCTTIIESGLDIPNCNTIIVEGADRFGLSQLYQLRGRVGRFNRQAYCHLLLHRHAQMLDKARKRLSALRQYNQLGAGFKIAMRDLELRGAGNLLGAQQSGHIAGVGFELYCQLLRQSISRIKGEPTAMHVRASIRLDFVFVGEGDTPEAYGDFEHSGYSVLKQAELDVHRTRSLRACIPFEYISETRLRIDFYRRIAMCDSIAALREIQDALRDRFGSIPEPVEILLAVTEIRLLAEQKGILSVESEGNRLKCLRASKQKDDYVKVGTRFPRLTAQEPRLRLTEIKNFIQRHA